MTKRVLDITSLAVAVAGGVLAVSNQLLAIPGLPGWLTQLWPLVLATATLVDRIGNIVLRQSAPPPQQIEEVHGHAFDGSYVTVKKPIQPMPATPQSKIP